MEVINTRKRQGGGRDRDRENKGSRAIGEMFVSIFEDCEIMNLIPRQIDFFNVCRKPNNYHLFTMDCPLLMELRLVKLS